MPVMKDIDQNGQRILTILDTCQSQDWIVFPEGALSWYTPDDPHFAQNVNFDRIEYWLEEIKKVVIKRKQHVIVGTVRKSDRFISNIAWYCDYHARNFVYSKFNLGLNDMSNFVAGNSLDVYTADGVTFGMQICRDNAFPEQWRLLKQKGAEVIFHLNNSIRDNDGVRKSVLVTRGFENQYFVCSSNNALGQHVVPSLVINPLGEIVAESKVGSDTISAKIDLGECRNDYRDQIKLPESRATE